MPAVHPFNAIQYAARAAAGPADLSALVAPPYDVLDAEGKASLLRKSDQNIVAIDLPHLPAKELGPASAYEGAATRLKALIAQGILARRGAPAMFVYRQTFEFQGKQCLRSGMACTLEVVPFGPRAGGGVLPHEETFSGPKEDRMALMKATRTQLSPIFGLHQDEHAEAASLISRITAASGPACVARTDDGTLHEAWNVDSPSTIAEYARALRQEDVFIADGHHRYTTALNYLKTLEASGPVPADHPARRCMFVLIGMSDPGLVIGPTHRVLGGMRSYSFPAFEKAAAGLLDIRPAPGGIDGIEAAMGKASQGPGQRRNVFGLYDFMTGNCCTCSPCDSDPLAAHFPGKPPAWRTLDVALVQYLIVEKICQPALNGGEAVKWAFPHSIAEVADIGAGKERGSGGGKAFTPQLGVIVRPTPLSAVREISRANELMPQKSTFFYPKLATGLFLNPLE